MWFWSAQIYYLGRLKDPKNLMEKVEPMRMSEREGLFFDPRAPEVPEQVFGIDSEQLIDATKTVGRLALAAPYHPSTHPVTKYGYSAVMSAEDAVRVAPLFERVVAGEQLEPEEVRPYRKPIKRILKREHPSLILADRAIAASALIGVGIPARKRLNRRIEAEFIERAPKLVESAREVLDAMEPYVDKVSAFENPQAQVRSEIGHINSIIKDGAHESARSHGRPVSAGDVATSIERGLERIAREPEQLSKGMPLTTGLVRPKPFKQPEVSHQALAVGAKEIVEGLDKMIPEDQRDPEYVENVKFYRHPLRWLAQFFRRRKLDRAEEIMSHRIPAAIDLVPNSGREVRSMFDRLKRALGLPGQV